MWWVAGLTENKTKPSSWGLAELGNKLSGRGWWRRICGVVAQDMWWVGAGLTENKTKPSSQGLAELGNNMTRHYKF